MKKLLLLILFQPIVIAAFCQYPKIHYERISDLQGLNDHWIKCMLQDHKGFIWIGGENGLYRFDGYDFVHYKDPPGCKNCPHFYPVYDVVEDNQGMLWTISFNGVTLYNPEKERSLVAYRFGSASTTGGSYIFQRALDLFKDSRGNIWAPYDMGVIRFSYKENCNNKELTFNKGPESFLNIDFLPLSYDTISTNSLHKMFCEDSDGNIWIGSTDGIYVLRKGDTLFYRFEIEAEMKTNSRTYVYDILQQNEDTFWILAASAEYLMTNVKNALHGSVPDGSALCFTKFSMANNLTSIRLFKDRKDNTLIGTNLDVFKFKGTDNKGMLTFESLYKNMIDKNDYRGSNRICSILNDRSGMLWIGHMNFGIMKFNPDKSQFISYNNLSGDHFTNPDISHINFDFKGNLWLGTGIGGIYKIQRGTNYLTRYDLGNIFKNQIACMDEIYPGIFWVGLVEGGVIEFNTITGKFHDPLPEGRIAEKLRQIQTEVNDILKDKNQLYLTTSDGLFVYDIMKRNLVQFSYPQNDSIRTLNNWFISPVKLKNGEIISASSYHGINKINYDPEKDNLSVTCIIADSVLRKRNINLTYSFRLYQDSQGSLWLVEKTGLHRISLEKGEIYDYKLFKNIEFPEASSIIEDNQSNLWIGTQFGLCRFNINTGQVKSFTEEDGIPITSHTYNSVCKDKDGRLYFGGTGGFYSFHPDSIKTNTYIPPVVITDFRLFNRSINADTTKNAILTNNISYTRLIELHHNQNNLSIEFAALDYNLPLKNLYAYKLEGYLDDWVETDAKSRLATYTNLHPGTYTFRVKGSNNDGVWNEDGASLTIIIHKPWWATTFAWFIYVLIFLSVTPAYIRWRLWQLKKEKTELEKLVLVRTHLIEEQKEEILTQRNMVEQQNQRITELDQIKSRFFTNISHEFRTPLSLIQSPVEELLDDPHSNEKQRRKLNMVQRNALRLLNLVNQLLDIAKIDGSKMKLELIESDVMKHLKAIAGAFNSMAETKSIRYYCHFATDEILSWFDPDKLEKIATNLLSNAFKFTPEGGEIEFRAHYIKRDDTQIPLLLEFVVKDTGPGIPPKSLEKIFDRFYQLEESVKPEGGGTGIGLSLARDLARLSQGDITVESELSKGSIFSVQIPLGKDHLDESEFIVMKNKPETVALKPESYEEPDEDVLSDREERSEHEKPVILLVEDNRDIRMQLSDNLNRDYLILIAADGVAGLKKATETIPDLVITDLMMPGMDGIELCHKLKTDLRTSHIPVIMLTAKVTLEDKITGLQTGADDYIPKPFQMAEVKAKVANLIEQRKKLRERFSREVTLQPADIAITPLDEQFLKRALEVVEKHMNDEDFGLADLMKDMNMTRSTLFRKLHALTNQSPTEFIRILRLKRAASLLRQNFGNVTQVSLEVGFNSLSYFNRSFKKLYGISPKDYMKQN